MPRHTVPGRKRMPTFCTINTGKSNTMKTLQPYFKGHGNVLGTLIILALILHSCRPDKKAKIEEKLDAKKDGIIHITTTAMDFTSPDTIPSGWNTFAYQNKSSETHFFLFDKYPNGKTIQDTKNEVFPPFDKGMDLINEGKTEAGYAEFNKLPAWFFEVVYSGGSGLVSPNMNSTTTVNLEPGYYIMECYVKMPNGKFHVSMGMAKPIIVSNKKSEVSPPKATTNITISSTEGINYNGSIAKGPQVFSVEFKDQITHENFVGHDVNLVKLADTTKLEILENWMNWTDPKGLITPAPEGVTFLGGVNDSPAGSVGYFKVDLEPGIYALVSEVPNTIEKGMLKTFTVSE